MAPVVLGQKRYGLRALCHEADVKPLSVVLQVNAWDKMIKWWMRLSHHPMVVHKVKALHEYGYSYQVKGFHHRPVLNHAVAVSNELWKYFHPQDNGRTVRSRIEAELVCPAGQTPSCGTRGWLSDDVDAMKSCLCFFAM